MIQLADNASPLVPFPASSFEEWRSAVVAAGVAPVIAVAGSRGKSIVVRLLDHVFRHAGLRTALWTNQGVEIGGCRQVGELVPWSQAVIRAARNDLDIVIQELDWSMVHAVGLPPASYPVAAITNLCVNSDTCLVQAESRRASRAMTEIERAVCRAGSLILNGDDFAVARANRQTEATIVLVGSSADSPVMRVHLQRGGSAAWTKRGEMRYRGSGDSLQLGATEGLEWALAGSAAFQVQNAMVAASTAIACGLPATLVAAAIATFRPDPQWLPGSFNVVRTSGLTVVLDRPAPSWFLQASLRAIAHIPAHRLLTVVGDLSGVPHDDLPELGRLLGRGGGAVLLGVNHHEPEQAALFRLGLGANEVPPIILATGSERDAVSRALSLAQPGDLLYVLARDPGPVLSLLNQPERRSPDLRFTTSR